MISNVLFSSNSDEWSTPQTLFDTLNEEFHFTLDPCAKDENAKCKMYYTISENGLEKTWTGHCVFCNPPYSQIQKWVKKCAEEAQKGATVVMLIPARTDTRWFHDYIYKKADIRFIKGRLRFSDSKNSAPFPSMIVIWNGGMADLISRQAAIDAINRAVTKEVARWSVEELPSVEVKPVKRGKWIVEHGVLYGHGKDVHYGDLWHCSECGRREIDVEGWDYCPTCGAKMEERREDGDGDG